MRAWSLEGVFFVLAGAAMGQDILTDCVAGPDGVYVMLPPKAVCGSGLISYAWSPDGRYLLASVAETVTPDMLAGKTLEIKDLVALQRKTTLRLVLWDGQSGESRTVWTGAERNWSPAAVQWFASGDAAIVSVRSYDILSDETESPPRSETKIFALSAAGGEAEERLSVTEPPDAFPISVQVSPSTALAVVVGDFSADRKAKMRKRTARLLTPDGFRGADVEVPGGSIWGIVEWSDDGTSAVLTNYVQEPRPAKPRWQRWGLDFQAGKAIEQASGAAPKFPARPPETVLSLASPKQSTKRGEVRAGFRPVWLETKDKGEPKRALVTADGLQARLSPPGDAVAFVSSDALFVRRLVMLDREAFTTAFHDTKRGQLLLNVRSVGLAFQMFASDNDDKLPGPGADLYDKLGPYIKDLTFLDGFVYTWTGGTISAIGEPEKTELGYIPFEDGRFVAFADSHSEFRKDKPPVPPP